MKGAIAKSAEIHRSDPDHYVSAPAVREPPLIRRIHFETTGPEIWDDTEGQNRRAGLRHWTGAPSRAFLYQASTWEGHHLSRGGAGSQPILTQTRKGEPLEAGPHKIQGIGAGFIPARSTSGW